MLFGQKVLNEAHFVYKYKCGNQITVFTTDTLETICCQAWSVSAIPKSNSGMKCCLRKAQHRQASIRSSLQSTLIVRILLAYWMVLNKMISENNNKQRGISSGKCLKIID